MDFLPRTVFLQRCNLKYFTQNLAALYNIRAFNIRTTVSVLPFRHLRCLQNFATFVCAQDSCTQYLHCLLKTLTVYPYTTFHLRLKQQARSLRFTTGTFARRSEQNVRESICSTPCCHGLLLVFWARKCFRCVTICVLLRHYQFWSEHLLLSMANFSSMLHASVTGTVTAIWAAKTSTGVWAHSSPTGSLLFTLRRPTGKRTSAHRCVYRLHLPPLYADVVWTHPWPEM